MKKLNFKFGDKVFVKTGKEKIEKGFIWKANKRKILIAVSNGRYIEAKPCERKLVWILPSDKWIWEELK